MAQTVREWLERIGLARYAQAFEANDLALDLVADLSDGDLKDLGVKSMGHRKMILRAIGDLPSQQASERTEGDPNARHKAKASESQAERRQITIMFCDLVGSTQISSELDPEDMRDVIRAYQNAVAGEVSRFEGHVAKFMGDGVMVLFGYPRAHEDDPERAIRTAMAILGAMPHPQLPNNREIKIRIGVATGQVVVGDLVGEGAAQEEAVVGDTPNLAARLQALASPNEILIADRTRALSGNAFLYDDIGEQRIKGLPDPVRVWRIEGERKYESRFEERRRSWTALVGRREEVDLLLKQWRRAQRGDGQATILSGEAGIGKSRVIEALYEHLEAEDFELSRFQCSPYHANSALYPIIRSIERRAGFSTGDLNDEKVRKLESFLAQTSAKSNQANLPLFCDLLSLQTDRLPAIELTPQQKKAQTLSALADLLTPSSLTLPVLNVFEDVHWADPTTLELLSLLLERVAKQPILVVITHRPEFDPPWEESAHVNVLTLKRLAQEHCVEMVKALARGKEIPGKFIDEIVARADGIPLFLEELTMTLLESAPVREKQNTNKTAGSVERLAIPNTLHDSLMARLDRFPHTKKVTQIGAVIGREFTHELIVAVAPQDRNEIEEALEQLVEAELLIRRGQMPDADYMFRHSLVRDAAYESLLKTDRRQHHATVAQILDHRFPIVAANEPEIVARHFTEAAMAFEAVRYWQKAAQRAIKRSANKEAEIHLAKGLEVLQDLPATDKRQRLEASLQNTRGVCLMPTRGFGSPEVAEAFSTAASIYEAANDNPGRFAALRGLGQYQMISGDLRGAAEQTRKVMHLATDLGDHGALIEAHHLGWITLTFTGDFGTARDHANSGISLYDHQYDHELTHIYSGHDPGVCCRSFGALPLWQLGYSEQAFELSRQGKELAAALGHPFSEVVSLWGMCLLHQLHRDHVSTLGLVENLIDRSVEGGFALMKTTGELLKAWAIAEQGDLEAGISGLRGGMEQLRADGTEFSLPCYYALLGELYGRNGQTDEGLSAIQEGLDLANKNGDRFNLPELHRVMGELMLARSSTNDVEASVCFERAIRIATEQKAKFLELRASVSFANLLGRNKKFEEAHQLLHPIYETFVEGFDTRDLADAKEVLDSIC